MSTRSITILREDDGTEVAVMYRQSDGYPTGHGEELREFLSGMIQTNGIRSGMGRTFNGAGCLAAQIVSHFKAPSRVGCIYLHPAGTRNCNEEYVYEVTPQGEGKGVRLKVTDCERTLFEGNVGDFDAEKAEQEASAAQ